MNLVQELAERLLDPTSSPGEQHQAVNTLFDTLSEWIEFDDADPSEAELADTWVEGGRAISPREAARCLREVARTTKFMRAVQAAIASAKSRFPGEIIRVVYAGCGPFAPLVLPLAHRWSADEVHYLLLDIHERSLEAAERLADRLGLDKSSLSFQQADAVKFKIPGPPAHILVTETMTQGLGTETQVAICANLVPQLHPEALLIPERIDLTVQATSSLSLAGQSDDGHQSLSTTTSVLGLAMRLDRDNASTGGECFEIPWPEEIPEGLHPMLHTRITVFDDIILGDRECSLNLPIGVPMPEGSEIGERLAFHYHYQPKPGLRSVWIGPTRLADHLTAIKATDSVGSLQLPLSFDPGPLQTELSALLSEELLSEEWAQHPNTGDYQGDWRSLALRSPSGQNSDTATFSCDPADYVDTDALQCSPQLAAVIRALPGQPTSARLLSLAPGAQILEHRDRGTHLWGGLARLHVPIQTHPDVDFQIDAERVHMKAGECWYINANHLHAVHNASAIERVHLVVDCAVNEADQARFVEWGHPPQAPQPFGDPSINRDNVANIIQGLEAMGEEAGMQRAAILRKQASAAGIPIA